MVGGAFGAHWLADRLSPKDLDTFEIAVRYQMYHALALVLVGIMATQRSSIWLNIAGAAFLIGVLLFSGLLYALVASGVKVLGAIVPLGGMAMIAGWIALAAAAWGKDLR